MKHKIISIPFLTSIFLLFLLVTNLSLSFEEGIDWVDANDVYSYLKISTVAPILPTEKVAYHFSQRFIPHYIVGCISHYSGLNLSTSYQLLNILLLYSIFIISFNLINKFSSNILISLVFFSYLVLSPFTFRLNIMVPGLLADLVFILGMSITICGIVYKRLLLILLGIFIALIGKQMILLALPGVLLSTYAFLITSYGRSKSLFIILLIGFYTILSYFLLINFTSNFAFPNSIVGNVLFGLFFWIFNREFSLRLLAEHILRIMLPVIPIIMLLLMTPNKIDRIRKLNLMNIGFLLMFLGPVSYAFFPGPAVQMGNQSRYVASALLPLILFTLSIIKNCKLEFKKIDYFIYLCFLIFFTYHHKYAFMTSTQITFFITQLISFIFLYYIIKTRVRIPS